MYLGKIKPLVKTTPPQTVQCKVCRLARVAIGEDHWSPAPDGDGLVCTKDICRELAGMPRLPRF